MTREKLDSWIAQIMAAVGVSFWAWVAAYFFKFYHIALIIAFITGLVTIINIVREARTTEPLIS